MSKLLLEVFEVMVRNDFSDDWGYDVFRSEANEPDDVRQTIYKKNGVQVNVCQYWNYFEILGLERDQFDKVKDIYQSYITLKKRLVAFNK